MGVQNNAQIFKNAPAGYPNIIDLQGDKGSKQDPINRRSSRSRNQGVKPLSPTPGETTPDADLCI